MAQRLIDPDAVYKILESCEIRKATIGNPLTDWEYGYTCGIERAESEIECAPTLDAVPVRHGKWIKADSQQYFRKHYPAFTCSECGQRKDSQKTWNYCPNCGVRMDEE